MAHALCPAAAETHRPRSGSERTSHTYSSRPHWLVAASGQELVVRQSGSTARTPKARQRLHIYLA